MQYRWVLRCGLCFAVVGMAQAQTQSPSQKPESLTLRHAVELALEHHPSLRAADANVRSSSAALVQAQSSYFPSLGATASAQRTDGAFVFNPSIPSRIQSYNNYSTGLQLQQTLYDFGKTSGKVSANQDYVEASSADYETTRENVIVNVQLAYLTLVGALRVEKVDEEAVALAAQHLARANAFYSVGRRPQFDVTKAEVDLANTRVNLIRARNQSLLASVQLENAMGVHPRTGYALSDTFEVARFDVSLDSARALAFENRSDLRAAEARLRANRALASAAWDQHLPTLSAFGNWTWNGFNFPLASRWNAGVTLSLPIFQGFSVSAQVNQAEASADAAEANADLLKEAVTLDVRQGYWGVKEAEERIAAARKLVEQAEQNLVLAEKQYAAGVGTALEVTDAQVSLSNARITKIQALYDHNSSLIRLRRSMGMVE